MEKGVLWVVESERDPDRRRGCTHFSMRRTILSKHHLQVATPRVAMSVLKFELRVPHSCVVLAVKFFGWPQFFVDNSQDPYRPTQTPPFVDLAPCHNSSNMKASSTMVGRRNPTIDFAAAGRNFAGFCKSCQPLSDRSHPDCMSSSHRYLERRITQTRDSSLSTRSPIASRRAR
jgi:hypothetical protein